MIKSEKIEFVKNLKEEVKRYKVVGVMPINGIPDRLVQKVRNGLKADTKMVVARKKLVARVLEDENHKKLLPFVEGNVVLVLSNKELSMSLPPL
ncbi:50S ribosomal protein L10, partial [Candidatus Marsarchaeota archaeon]|nr:50S ribosomal protein L10 [Candidatus Marsarchaeota archaeon]